MTLSSFELGELMGLLAALAWGVTGLLVRAHDPGVHTIVINALRHLRRGVRGHLYEASRSPAPQRGDDPETLEVLLRFATSRAAAGELRAEVSLDQTIGGGPSDV